MGHSDIKTTYGYILNNHYKEKTAKNDYEVITEHEWPYLFANVLKY